MGGDSRSRRRERSSSSETDKKKLKKSRRYKKRTYSSEEISGGSEDDFKRVSPEKKKSKSKSKKKSRESPSPEKRKRRRRSSSSLSSSPERKSSKKKKASKYDSEEESPVKKKKKKHRESRSRSKSPVKVKSTGGKVKEKNKERKEEKSKKRYDSESEEEDDRQMKERVKHKDKRKEDGAAKGTGDRDREKNGEHRKDKERGEEHHKERHKDQDVDTSSDKEERVIHREPREEKTESKEKKATREKETKSKDRDKREKTGEYKEIDKQKERDKDRERERVKDKEREKERDKERGKERDRERGHKEEERETKEKVRSRDQREDKGRDRDRDRDRERNRDRDQDKERKAPGKDERHRSKKHDRHDDKESSESKSGKDKSEGAVALDNIEDAMRRRKERVEAWRLARQHKDGEEMQEEKVEGKKWSLEDDDDDDEEDVSVKKNDEKVEEDEVDPLDAYMKEVQKQVKKFNVFGQTAKEKGKTTTIVTTVVKKAENDMGEKKPEVIEQNQDLMEYSSEEGEKEDILEGNAFAAMKQKKKKELLAADHSKIYYRPFRKNFYVEVPDLAKMTDEEVDKYRLELGSIRVVGREIPKPIKTWAQSGVNNKILEVLKKCNYEKPTPVQAQGIPSIMSGRDVIGIAKTGSGKTLAFLLPMFRHVLDQPPLDENDGPIAIIMTPTRELALQINKETKKFCKPLGLQAVCIYGGSGISEQIAELKRGAEIIVCTPGRMIDMLTANSGRVTNCRRCTYLVLDEADRMFDMGFEPQVMKIIANIRDDRQTVLFSATFPRQLEGLARKLLKSPIEIEVGGRSIVCSDISQHVVVIEEDNKFLKLLELLGMYQEQGSILVFVEKQDSADVLFKDLLKRGYPCLSLHGGMDQFDRDSTIADFKNGNIKIMVATSVAARGLDVKQLNLVVNYDCPNHYEDYVHRVGRTGRAGNKGVAFTLITPDEGKLAQDIIKALETSKAAPPEALKTLWQEYKEQMKAEGKKVKREKNKGFGGKGFKFDEEEEAKSNEMKKMQKWALGLQDSDDEAEAAENAMDKIEDDLNKAFHDSKPKKAPPQLAPGLAGQQPAVIDQDKMKKASSIAAKINIKISQGQNADKTQHAATQILKGGALEQIKGIGLAKQLADKVNAKLNYKAPETEKDEEGQAEPEKLEKYESEIDINDLPQQARWRITSKETISRVCEVSEAGITVRGSYVPPGSKVKEGEKRLHLYIESLSERAIQIARAEVRRLLKEELIKFESSTYRPQAGGRYKVV